MPDTSPLGIPRMLDSDPLADVGEAIRDAVDKIDAMLGGRAAAWNQAGVSVGAGATVSMGSATLPAFDDMKTLHGYIFHDSTAASENLITLIPDYADNSRVANIGNLKFGTGYPFSSPGMFPFMLFLDAGSDTTSISFTLTAQNALDDARVLTWIT